MPSRGERPGGWAKGCAARVLPGISCRDDEAVVEDVPGVIGLSKSKVSWEFKKATAQQYIKQKKKIILEN